MSGTQDIYCHRLHSRQVDIFDRCPSVGCTLYMQLALFNSTVQYGTHLRWFARHQNVMHLHARYVVNVCIPAIRIFLADVQVSDVHTR
jgi:hypothetical protein